MRGDRPLPLLFRVPGRWFTPHARGSTWNQTKPHKRERVYPACAGIDPTLSPIISDTVGLPRMRGDRPVMSGRRWKLLTFTTHARGSTTANQAVKEMKQVYPACAGIDHQWNRTEYLQISLPRMRGDRPLHDFLASRALEFTPHARGSTDHLHWLLLDDTVYPACAGIDPGCGHNPAKSHSLPRMRGDRPG